MIEDAAQGSRRSQHRNLAGQVSALRRNEQCFRCPPDGQDSEVIQAVHLLHQFGT